MAKRPCRTETDLKRIWRLMLPDTPLPACVTEENAAADAGKDVPPLPHDDPEMPGGRFR